MENKQHVTKHIGQRIWKERQNKTKLGINKNGNIIKIYDMQQKQI